MSHSYFVHLRNHTAYSLSEGALRFPEIIKSCKKHKMTAVAITDTDNMFGALEFSVACSKSNIQPIIGTQIKIDIELPVGIKRWTNRPAIVLIAQNETGYKNLLKLSSKSHLETNMHQEPHIYMHDLEKHAEGVICLSGGVEGPIGWLLLDKQKKHAEDFSLKMKNIFKDRFYMEIQRHGMADEADTEDQFIKISYDHNIPLVATNEPYFIDPDMYEAHDALLCVSAGAYVTEIDRRKVTKHHYFKSPEEMYDLFQDLPEALENTVTIAQRCSYMPLPHKPLLPPFPSEKGKNEEDELKIQAEQGLEKRLENQVYTTGMLQDDKEKIYKEYSDRLKHELEVINQMGYPGYFLIVSDFIKHAKSKGIPVGPGRGSGAGSLVAWSLLITDIDPIKFGLIFERFLNPERVSMPDFDIDFCQDRREEVINYVKERYGEDKVAQIITFGKLQARAVLRDVGRVLQMPYGQVDKICKMVPSNPANPVTLQEALDQEPDLMRMRRSDPTVDKLMDIGLKLEGLYRHASTHAAGIIIGDRPLDELVPTYRDPRSDMPVTQFSMKYVEMAGLVKFDFLGLKTLTILEESAKVARSQGYDVHISKIPLDDKKTFDLLNRIETTGVFQLESQGMRDVIRRLKPDQFEEIIALVALYRPGPMDDIPTYVSCKHGDKKVIYMHPEIEPILKETFGVMVYQEQVMKIAQVLAGYTLGGADLLRRAMGKKIKSEMDAQRKIFIEGTKKHFNIPEGKSNKIFDSIAKFAGYGFNKSHSAPYGLIAYQTAYMKANYPHEFMAATMTYDIHNTDKLAFYRQELMNMGIDLLPPDVNHSMGIFSVEEINGVKSVRYALGAIKNVGEAAMNEVVQERQKNGNYKDIFDFVSRNSSKVLNKRQMENLIMSGAFDSMHGCRKQLFDSLEMILGYAAAVHADKTSNQASLFGAGTESVHKPNLSSMTEWSSVERLHNEFSAVGFYLSAHPLDEYKNKLQSMKTLSAMDLQNTTDSGARMAGIVTSIKKKVSKKGKRFAFVSLTDATGDFEVMVFEETLREFQDLLESNQPLLVNVAIRYDEESNPRLTANRFQDLAKENQKERKDLILKVQPGIPIDPILNTLETYRGGTNNISLILSDVENKSVNVSLSAKFKIDDALMNVLETMHGVIVHH
jgi:DNA polymerase-3 subunit alpha